MSLHDDIKVVREHCDQYRGGIYAIDSIDRILSACEEMEKTLDMVATWFPPHYPITERERKIVSVARECLKKVRGE